jgi:hypothetical protein
VAKQQAGVGLPQNSMKRGKKLKTVKFMIEEE